jgi:pilus assembly protein CpaC
MHSSGQAKSQLKIRMVPQVLKKLSLYSIHIFILGALLFSVSFTEAQAFDTSRVVEVSLGGSTILNLKAKSVTLTDQTIAEISKSAEGILLIGRKVGETNLVALSESSSDTYLIKVSLPALAIQSELTSLFPNERDVRTKAVGGALVLEGTVSTIQVINQMEAVAKGYLLSPSIVSLGVKPNVINLLTVRSPQQVQIDVSFAEVNRSSLRQIGALINGGRGVNFQLTGVGDISNSTGASFGEIFLNPDPTGSLPIPLDMTLKLLTEHSLSRTLAKPTLVAMSGEQATFLAGGEQPVPQVSGFGQPSVEYKKFGIQLDFSPIVLGDRTIELNTTMSVSVLDKSQGLQIGGTDVPLFRTRSSGTTVRLQHGQSFAIAGLLQDQLENVKRGFPGLGDIPIIGVLFNSRQFQRNETELVVVITARLISPLNGADMPSLPGKNSRDPNDVGVFLMNVFEETSVPQAKSSNPPMRNPRVGQVEDDAHSNTRVLGSFGYWR